jgi:aspartate-semialdehyde dehydrogenase
VVSTYQSVSGTGREGIQELDRQVRGIFNYKDIVCQVYPHQIAFNCLPHVGAFSENGYTQEELILVNETKKILEDDNLRITATTVRIPVFYGHSEAVNIETEEKITAQEVRNLFLEAPGIKVVDEPQNNLYPHALDVAGEDNVFAGRIREDESIENGINLWIVADNIRKGAALNTVQIAELMIQKGFL